VQLSGEEASEKVRRDERMGMESSDPAAARGEQGDEARTRLAPVSRADVLKKIGTTHASNIAPVSSNDNGFEIFALSGGAQHLTDFRTPEDLAGAISEAHAGIYKNLRSVAILMARKDEHFRALREELAVEMVERRKREEEVYSYICI